MKKNIISIIPFIITIINLAIVIVGIVYVMSCDYKKLIHPLYGFLEVYVRISIIPAVASILLTKTIGQCKYFKFNYFSNFIYIIIYIILYLFIYKICPKWHISNTNK